MLIYAIDIAKKLYAKDTYNEMYIRFILNIIFIVNINLKNLYGIQKKIKIIIKKIYTKIY